MNKKLGLKTTSSDQSKFHPCENYSNSFDYFCEARKIKWRIWCIDLSKFKICKPLGAALLCSLVSSFIISDIYGRSTHIAFQHFNWAPVLTNPCKTSFILHEVSCHKNLFVIVWLITHIPCPGVNLPLVISAVIRFCPPDKLGQQLPTIRSEYWSSPPLPPYSITCCL